MWPFKKDKFKKLKREDVVDSIVELEKQEMALEEGIIQKARQIEEMLAKGKTEKSRDIQLLLAKKITALREEKENDVKRCMYLMYNIKLAKRLKDAIDDNQFIVDTGKVSMRDLLSDQKGLAKFLNKALDTKVKDEEILTTADDIFSEVKDSYTENNSIYGVQTKDDELLAMFETANGIEDDLGTSQTTEDTTRTANADNN